MTKKILTLLSLSLLLSACGASTTPVNNPTSQSSPAAQVSPVSDDNQFKGNLFGLMGLNQSKKCTLKLATDKMNGTYYISGGKVRAIVNITTDAAKGTTMETNMLIDSQNMYFWSEKPIAFGSKTSLEKMKSLSVNVTPQAGTDPTQQFNQDQVFDCQPWQADNSMFEIPAKINFVAN